MTSYRQAEFLVILIQNGKTDPEGQDQWPLFSYPMITELDHTYPVFTKSQLALNYL